MSGAVFVTATVKITIYNCHRRFYHFVGTVT